MCGIAFLAMVAHGNELNKDDDDTKNLDMDIEALREKNIYIESLSRRGPDVMMIRKFRKTTTGSKTEGIMIGAVLGNLRSEFVFQQPVHDEHGNWLVFNGEIFAHRPEGSKQVLELFDTIPSDTNWLLEHLRSKINEGLVPFLNSLRGPWALIYYDKPSDSVIFARDPLGERSLCCTENLLYAQEHNQEIEDFMIASVIISKNSDQKWCELPVDNVFHYHFQSKTVHVTPRLLFDFLSFESAPFSNTTEPIIMAVYDALAHSIRRRCHNHTGILFSGGIDSVVLAAIADQFIPSGNTIELVNVVFGDSEECSFESADRRSALDALDEVRQVSKNPNRFELIFVNVTLQELESHKQRICDLISPRPITVMDFNLGSCLYFGARYKSNTKAKILLNGLGADELMGGYQRHGSTWLRSGTTVEERDRALRAEMDRDLQRLHERNLGRDDRCISDAGREVRHPFLDIDFIRTLRQLPLCNIVNFDMKPGEGDKLILRTIARDILNLPRTSCRVKRAMQFGSNIGKLVGGKNGEELFTGSLKQALMPSSLSSSSLSSHKRLKQ